MFHMRSLLRHWSGNKEKYADIHEIRTSQIFDLDAPNHHFSYRAFYMHFNMTPSRQINAFHQHLSATYLIIGRCKFTRLDVTTGNAIYSPDSSEMSQNPGVWLQSKTFRHQPYTQCIEFTNMVIICLTPQAFLFTDQTFPHRPWGSVSENWQFSLTRLEEGAKQRRWDARHDALPLAYLFVKVIGPTGSDLHKALYKCITTSNGFFAHVIQGSSCLRSCMA